MGRATSVVGLLLCACDNLRSGVRGVPEEVKDLVRKDLEAIEKHDGFAISTTLDNAEDFSQYIPRGHYTRNEKFKRYFKAMMWYGRRMFRVEESRPHGLPIPDHWSEEHRIAETRKMLMATRLLYTSKVANKPAIEIWKALYIPTTLFAGRPEDLNPMEIKKLAEEVWGRLPTDSDLYDETISGKLAELSRKELAGEKLTEEDHLWIVGRKGTEVFR
jgi:hypothetical protein